MERKEGEKLKYSDLSIGDVFEKKEIVTAEKVETFAEITGDDNPLHLDEEFAKTTIFGRRIAHGVLGIGFISAVLGRHFPGPGTIYLQQKATFRKPVYIDEEVTVKVEIIDKIPEKFRLLLSTEVIKENGTVAVEGEALVIFRM